MPHEQRSSFGQRLRQFRLEAGLTQEELAERAGLTVKAIGALERGEREHPYPHTVQMLVTALGLSNDEHHELIASIPRRKSAPLSPPIGHGVSRLPGPSTQLLGRDSDVVAVVQLLGQLHGRLLTLTGPGGVGKTCLAAAVVDTVASRFADGVLYVELGVLDDPALVLPTIAAALHLRGEAGEAARVMLQRVLQTKQMLLVLDNMEHLLGAAADISAVRSVCPYLTVLVTSRAPLRLHDEQVYPVVPLALPSMDGQLSFDALAAAPAVQLFVRHARKAIPHFALTSTNASTIAAICHRLDGLPLAIELAAARVALLGTTTLLARLDQALPLLTGGARDMPDRQQTIRAAIGWSYNLLDKAQQAHFRRLAVFAGGWTLVAAEVVIPGTAGEVLQTLDALTSQSLLVVEPSEDGVRYRFLETIRAYALEQLQASGEELDACDQHCAYYAHMLDAQTQGLLSGAMHTIWQELAPDFDNIRAAWLWAVRRGYHQALAAMGQGMQTIYEVRGLFEEGAKRFHDAVSALRAAHAESPHDRECAWSLGQLLSLYGIRAARYGTFGEAHERLREGYALLEGRSDLLARVGTVAWLGYVLYIRGDYDEAGRLLEHSIELARAHNHSFFLAFSITHLALVKLAQGTGDARAMAEAGLAAWYANGHPRGTSSGLWALSQILLAQGNLDRAEQLTRASLVLGEQMHDRWGIGRALLQLARITSARGDSASAQAYIEDSIGIFTDLGERSQHGQALTMLGELARAEGKIVEARTHFEQALAIGEAIQLDPIKLRAQYGLATLMQDDNPAGTLTLLAPIIASPATEQELRDHAIALRDRISAPIGSPTASQPANASPVAHLPIGEALTPRELEVLSLLASGYSNQAIARELVVAVGTVKRHVNSILGKLNAQSRLEAVVRARALGLV